MLYYDGLFKGHFFWNGVTRMENKNRIKKLTISAMIMALYIVVLYFTQSFSFGAYQIRIATSIYAVSYLCPFLVIPLGIANFLANTLFGGLGIVDMLGGLVVGLITSYSIVLIKKKKLPVYLIILPIIIVPGLGVSLYLSYLLQLPYFALAASLCIGQIIPSICGYVLVKALIPHINKFKL